MGSRRQPPAAAVARRAMLEHAEKMGPALNGTDWRVLGAYIIQIIEYDRLEDRVADSVVMRITGLKDRKPIKESRQKLHDLGVLEAQPGTGRLASLVSFRRWVREPLPREGAFTPPLAGGNHTSPEEGHHAIERGGDRSPRGGAGAPTSVVLSESLSEGGLTGHVVGGDVTQLLQEKAPGDERELAKGYLRALEGDHGREPVERAVTELLGRGHRYQWAREVRGPLEQATLRHREAMRNEPKPCAHCGTPTTDLVRSPRVDSDEMVCKSCQLDLLEAG